MANLPPVLRPRYFDANGNPLAGGKLYTYQAGTSTPQETYTDQTAATPNANPIVLDANGECTFWLNPAYSYKFALKDSNDVQQWTVDNVVGLLGADAVVTASIANLAVTAPKIADDAVTADKLRDSVSTDADRAVTTNHIRNSSITGAKLDSSVADNSTIELSGTTLRLKDGGITQAKRAALGQQITASCGSFFSTANGARTDVTNLSASFTSTGRPVKIQLIPDGSANASGLVLHNNNSLFAYIMRDSTDVATFGLNGSATAADTALSVTDIETTDVPAAGTYTYKVQIKDAGASSYIGIKYAKLLVFER